MLNAWTTVSTLDRMLDDVMGSAFGTATNYRNFEPAIDVHASEDEVLFVCDVPGVKQADLEITLENHVLTIKGTRKFDGSERQQVMLGRPYGAFSRAFTLPDALDEDNLSANLSDGVLTIRIPKHAKAKPRRIQIGGGSEQKQLKE
jgi:HSP20 family protein